MELGMMILLGSLSIFGLLLLTGIRIVRPTHKMIIETLGKFKGIKESGFTYVIPIIQQSYAVNVTEQMVDVKPQQIITKDNLNAVVDAVVYYQIKDVKKATYNADDHKSQLVSLARTTLRAVIGGMSFSEANEKREKINQEIETILDKETDSYGVDVLRVELQKIDAPQDVQAAMNEVVKAERKKMAAKDTANALEIESDGIKRSEIKKAEGEKQAAILRAQGQSEAFELINKSFKGASVELKKLEVTQASLENNSKIVLTEKGISPQIIMDAIPVNNVAGGGKQNGRNNC